MWCILSTSRPVSGSVRADFVRLGRGADTEGRSYVSRTTSKLVTLLSLTAIVPMLLASACSGAEFESGGDAGSAVGGSSNGGSGVGGMGKAGTATAGGASKCGGPEDCSDGDSCTNDFCTIEGTCASAAKCSGPQRCCEGDCAECCEDTDCDDGVGCTTNTCFAGKCMFVPDDAACGPDQFCSVTESCRPLIACDVTAPGATCTDSSPCTTDTCDGGFCDNQYCDTGSVCCNTGCAEECCEDADCGSVDDPCAVGSCEEGKCHTVPLCSNGDKCCPSADGKSASCGTCCAATECDDGVNCTDDSCTGARLTCANNPNNGLCAASETCSADAGCVDQVECDDADDCSQGGCGRCDQGVCKYDCPLGTSCCQNGNICAACCDDASCDDGDSCTTDACDTLSHTCTHVSTCECRTGFDCQGVTTQAAIPPGEGTPCPSCVDGRCVITQCFGSCCSSGCYVGLCPD